jgi:hypothetical protein
LGGVLTTLTREDTNSSDLTRIASEQQGVGHFQTVLIDLSSGNAIGALPELNAGIAAISGFGSQKLLICGG